MYAKLLTLGSCLWLIITLDQLNLGSHIIRNNHFVFYEWVWVPEWLKYFCAPPSPCVCAVTVNLLYIIRLFAFHEHRLRNIILIISSALCITCSYFTAQINRVNIKKGYCWMWILCMTKSLKFTSCFHILTDCNMKSEYW